MFYGIPSFSGVCAYLEDQWKFKNRGTAASISEHNDPKHGKWTCNM